MRSVRNLFLASAVMASSAAAETVDSKSVYGSADFVPTPQRPINFRGDPTGGYPGATPPTRISEQENLRWKVNVGQGCGSAIVVGERVFVQAAPNALVCLDKATGKELWRRDKHVGQLDPKSTAAQCDGLMDQIGAIHVRYQQLHLKMRGLPDKSPELIALQAEIKQVEGTLPKGLLQVPGSKVSGYGNRGIYLIVMTPCSDGQTVVAVFPTGIAVAYDLQGKWIWSTSVRTPSDVPKDWPPSNYTTLPGQLQTSINTCPVFTREGIVVVVYGLVTYGIEAQSGKIRWKQANGGVGNSKEGGGFSNASPVLGVIGTESFVATGNGDVFRVRDGFLVFRGSGPGSTCSASPAFADGVFHWFPLAVKVVPGDPPKGEILWSFSPAMMKELVKTDYSPDRPYLSGNSDFASSIIIGNKILNYRWYPQGIPQKLISIDAPNGKGLSFYDIDKDTSKIKPISGKNGTDAGVGARIYGGIVRAGNYLIFAHSDGRVKIIPINETFTPVRVCPMPDAIYGQPTCDGIALYVRTVNSLYRFDNPTVVISGANQFVDKTEVTFQSPHEGAIRYTLDGSEPTAQSAAYAKPIVLDRTATVSAAVFAPDGKRLPSSRREFTKREAKHLTADQWVKAEEVYELHGPCMGDDKESIQQIDNGAAIAFGPYEIADNLKTIEIMVALPPDRAGGKVHVRLDSKTGREIGVHQFQSTGGWQQYRTQKLALSGDPSGKHLLYFVFDGEDGICNLKQFRFLAEAAK